MWINIVTMPRAGQSWFDCRYRQDIFLFSKTSRQLLRSTQPQINPLRTKLYLSNLKTQFVPSSKHSPSVIKTGKLMLYREIIAVCSQIHTKHINTLCGQNVELLNVKLVVHILTTGL